jgi:hypothetical protein
VQPVLTLGKETSALSKEPPGIGNQNQNPSAAHATPNAFAIWLQYVSSLDNMANEGRLSFLLHSNFFSLQVVVRLSASPEYRSIPLNTSYLGIEPLPFLVVLESQIHCPGCHLHFLPFWLFLGFKISDMLVGVFNGTHSAVAKLDTNFACTDLEPTREDEFHVAKQPPCITDVAIIAIAGKRSTTTAGAGTDAGSPFYTCTVNWVFDHTAFCRRNTIQNELIVSTTQLGEYLASTGGIAGKRPKHKDECAPQKRGFLLGLSGQYADDNRANHRDETRNAHQNQHIHCRKCTLELSLSRVG